MGIKHCVKQATVGLTGYGANRARAKLLLPWEKGKERREGGIECEIRARGKIPYKWKTGQGGWHSTQIGGHKASDIGRRKSHYLT